MAVEEILLRDILTELRELRKLLESVTNTYANYGATRVLNVYDHRGN